MRFSATRALAAAVVAAVFAAVIGIGALGHGVLNAGATTSVHTSGAPSSVVASDPSALAAAPSHAPAIRQHASGAHATRAAYLPHALTTRSAVSRVVRGDRATVPVSIVTEQTQQLAYRSRAP